VEFLPRWLSDAYSKLLVSFGNEAFGFSQASRVLSVSKPMALKVVSGLSRKGALMVKKSALDEREKQYKLVQSQDLFVAQGIQASLPKNASFRERVNAMGEHCPYLVVGQHAVSLYTNWLHTELKELMVRTEDFDKWFAFLKNKESLVLVEPVSRARQKKFKEIVSLKPGLLESELMDRKEVNGFKVISPELLVLNLLVEQSEEHLVYALAVLVAAKKQINWSELRKLAEKVGLAFYWCRVIGFLMDALNKQAKRSVFPPKVVESFRPARGMLASVFSQVFEDEYKEKIKGAGEKFVSGERKKQLEAEAKGLTEPYKRFEERWCLKIYLPERVVEKVVEDLVK